METPLPFVKQNLTLRGKDPLPAAHGEMSLAEDRRVGAGLDFDCLFPDVSLTHYVSVSENGEYPANIFKLSHFMGR